MKFPLLNFLAYIGMVTVSLYSINTLSNTIPGSDKMQIDLLNKLDTLLLPFSPFDFTLSIWILIYGLLLIFVIMGIVNLVGRVQRGNNFTNKQIKWLFLLSCLFNSGWVVANMFHREGLSVIIMAALLITLMNIRTKFQGPQGELGWMDKYISRLAFSIYLGWISVVTFAHVSTWLLAQ